MRSHEEVVERLKAKNKEYIAARRKKVAGIVGVLTVVALICISVPIYRRLGRNTKPSQELSATPAQSSTPTGTPAAESTPTNDPTPTEEAAPTATVSLAPSEQRTTGTIEETNDNGYANEAMPVPGYIYASHSLRQMIQDNSGREDILFSVVLGVDVDFMDEEIVTYQQKYRERCDRNPVFIEYRQTFEQWFDSVYQPEHPLESMEQDAWKAYVAAADTEYRQVWKAEHSEEEWEDMQEILKISDDYANGGIRAIMKRLAGQELTLLRESGMLTYSYPIDDYHIGALITADQFENFTVSKRYSYFFKWTEVGQREDLEEKISGFVMKPVEEPAPPKQVVVIDDSDPRFEKRIRGEHDADEIVWIYLCFGNAWDEGQRILREQYPKEYAAYIELKESEEPWANDDPRTELADRGWALHNSLPGDWEDAQEEKYFARHPEYLQYRYGDPVYTLDMKVPWSLVPEIAKDKAITEIGRWPEDKRKPEEIGEYQGKPVYDLQGINEEKTWYEAIEE